MNSFFKPLLAATALLVAFGAQAQAPAGAPAGSTVLCNDGTYASPAHKAGACRGHQGVKTWFGSDDGSAGNAKAGAATAGAATAGAATAGAATAGAAAAGGAAAGTASNAGKAASTALPANPAPAGTASSSAGNAASAMRSSNNTGSPARLAPPTQAAAPGGGAGMVWVNDETKVYHCMGDRYYGKTKHGEYMSEAQAKAGGSHAAHNKACAS